MNTATEHDYVEVRFRCPLCWQPCVAKVSTATLAAAAARVTSDFGAQTTGKEPLVCEQCYQRTVRTASPLRN